MAVIRPTAPRRFRHFGSPEQQASDRLRSALRRKRAMKVIMLLLGGLFLTVLVAALGTVFMWLGWNHGVVPAMSFAKEISIPQAFCLSLALAGVGGMFKSTLTVNSNE